MEEKTVMYKNPNHATNLNKMRLDNKWCDIIIKVNELEFRAHKVILAANLHYFETMLSNDLFQESKEGVITMQCIEGADLETFILYAYTGEIMLTDSNALQLLEVANYLNEDGIKEACIELLTKHLKADQACRAYCFANNIDCVPLKNAARQMILSNFVNRPQINDYLDLNSKQLIDIFSIAINQPAEAQHKFLEGIIKWILYDAKERRLYTMDLLNSFDITKLNADDLIECLYENIDSDDDGIVKDIILFYHKNKSEQMKLQLANTVQALMVVQVGCNSAQYILQSYNFTDKKWSTIEELIDIPIDPRGVVLNNKVYYSLEEDPKNRFNVFDPKTKEITNLHTSNSILSLNAMCTCSRYVYMCGGTHKDGSRSDQVLKYDPRINFIETLTPMESKKSSAAAVFYQGSLHVLGGLNESSITLNSVEKYDSITKKWTAIPSMQESRFDHAVVILNEKLYVCGGFAHSSVEVYDPSKNCWQFVASMNKSRYHFLVIAYEGKLWAIGGDYDGTIEIYDPRENEWQIDHELSSGLDISYPIGALVPANCIAHEEKTSIQENVDIMSVKNANRMR